MNKPVAIAVVGFENFPQVFVTCEDGSVYRGGESLQTGTWSWDRLPALPLTPAGDAEANDFDPIRCALPSKVMQRPNGCWAACISTLTGIPLDGFPAVPDDARDEAWWDENGTRLRNEITAVLRKHGWRKESTWTDIPRGFAMAYGKSPRGYEHAVVVKDGELWHDPHPEGGGLLDVTQYEILVPILGKNENAVRRPARPRTLSAGRAPDGGGE